MCYKDKGEVSGTAGQETQPRLTRALNQEGENQRETAVTAQSLIFDPAFCFSPC